MTLVVILQLSRVFGALLGVGVGVVLILFGSAWGGLAIGVALGVAVGCLVGLLPPELVRHGIRFSLRFSDTARLKECLDREYGLAPFIVEELVRRGEPAGQFRDYVAALLRSESSHRRCIGKTVRRRWFPDIPLHP